MGHAERACRLGGRKRRKCRRKKSPPGRRAKKLESQQRADALLGMFAGAAEQRSSVLRRAGTTVVRQLHAGHALGGRVGIAIFLDGLVTEVEARFRRHGVLVMGKKLTAMISLRWDFQEARLCSSGQVLHHGRGRTERFQVFPGIVRDVLLVP